MTKTPEEIAAIADGLTSLEREIVAGSAPPWGSWIYAVSSDLCLKGLGERHGGSIQFNDTFAAVRAHLTKEPTND